MKIAIIGNGNVGSALERFDARRDDVRGARNAVIELAREVGFDAVNAGPLQNARWLETIGSLNIQLGYVVGHGTSTGFHYISRVGG